MVVGHLKQGILTLQLLIKHTMKLSRRELSSLITRERIKEERYRNSCLIFKFNSKVRTFDFISHGDQGFPILQHLYVLNLFSTTLYLDKVHQSVPRGFFTQPSNEYFISCKLRLISKPLLRDTGHALCSSYPSLTSISVTTSVSWPTAVPLSAFAGFTLSELPCIRIIERTGGRGCAADKLPQGCWMHLIFMRISSSSLSLVRLSLHELRVILSI